MEPLPIWYLVARPGLEDFCVTGKDHVRVGSSDGIRPLLFQMCMNVSNSHGSLLVDYTVEINMNLSFLFYFDHKVPVAGFQGIFQIIHTALKPPRNTLTFVARILVWPWVFLVVWAR